MSIAESTAGPRRTRIAEHLYEVQGRSGPRYLVIKRKDGRQLVRAIRAKNRTQAKELAPATIAALLEDAERGSAPVGSAATMRELVRAWEDIESGPARRTAVRTFELRKGMLERHVLPILGEETLVGELSRAHVCRLIDQLCGTVGPRGRTLSGSTIRNAVGALSAVLNFGVRNGSLDRNVCRDLVRGDLPRATRQSDPRYLEPSEVERLLAHLRPEMRAVAACCFFAALRISEALSLRWSDVDFDARIVHVPGSKTRASRADVPLVARLESELRAHRERHLRRGFATVSPNALVFQTVRGRSPGRHNVRRAIAHAATKAGLVAEGQEPVSPHDLRHSAAAAAYASGMNDVEVAALLRHANPNITRSTYLALSGDRVEKLAGRLAAVGFGSDVR